MVLNRQILLQKAQTEMSDGVFNAPLCCTIAIYIYLNPKGVLSDLRKSMATESPFKKLKNAFYFNLKALFVLEIFKFLF